jgi:serine/threonine-protein kinase
MADLRDDLQTTLGEAYTLERELGGGGMSRVFLAEDVRLRRRLVVKVLSPDLAAGVSLARFEREIGLAARLQHPHIVPLLFSGDTGGLPYYTMPFVEGESLRQRLTRGELPVAEAIRLTREIASALAYAHGHGIVHRDVKPENVLLSGGIALVADFGIAKAVADASATGSGLTGTGVSVGTPAYMSPEQVSADPNVDHRSDIYALGLIAYEMLAGHSPFAGRTGQAMLAAHVIDTPEPLQRRRPAVPDAVAALIMRCLEKRPADRPQQASEIVHALDALTTPTQTVARERRGSSNQRTRALVGVGAVVVIASVAGAWFTRAHSSRLAAAAPAPRLLIAPFENLTGDTRFNHIGLIAADRLAVGVAQRGSIDVVPSNTVLMALRDTTGGVAERLNRLSDATHAGLIVSGTVVLRGDSLMLQAQITDVRTGKVVNTLAPAMGSAADPTAAVDVLSDHLLGALGIRDLTILSRENRAPKFAAYQEFAAGFELFVMKGDVIGSRPFFKRAIAIDSTYTLAYLLLLRQFLNAGEYARADSMARVVERLPQGLNAIERPQLEYAKAELRGDIPGLLRAQQQIIARDSIPLALSLTGEAAVWMLRPALAIPALVRARPAYLLLGKRVATENTMLLIEAYHESGLHDRELRALMDDRGVFPDAGLFLGRLLRVYAGLRKPAAALALADTMLRDETVDPSAAVLSRVMTGADEFRAHGDTVTAALLIARARAWIGTHPSSAPSPDRRLLEGVVYLASGQPDSAETRFTLVARDSSRIDPAGYLGLARLARGDRPGAQAIADSLGALRRPWLFGRHTFWRAAIMGALGKRDLAVQLLRQAYSEGRPMHNWHYVGPFQPLHGFPAFEALVRPQRE